MKKIILLNGSPRKKDTYQILKEIQILFKNCQCEIISLSNYNITPCKGCESCIHTDSCILDDDCHLIFSKLKAADGIVIGSPVYLRQISGQLKIFIDRACSWYHRPALIAKPVLFALSTQVSGVKESQKYLDDLAIQWGMINCGTIAKKIFNRDKKISLKQIKLFLSFLDPQQKKFFRPSLKGLIEFQTQKILALELIPKDLEFWKKKGFLTKTYFFPCRINPFKKIISSLYFHLLHKIIKKNKV